MVYRSVNAAPPAVGVVAQMGDEKPVLAFEYRLIAPRAALAERGRRPGEVIGMERWQVVRSEPPHHAAARAS